MTDAFEARVVSIDGCTVLIDVLSMPAGPLDVCTSRSFALRLLEDAVRRSIDFIPWTDPERPRKASARIDRHEQAPLVRALRGENTLSEEWMREHVGLYIASSSLLERRNAMPEEALVAVDDAIQKEVGGELLTEEHPRWAPLRWARCHSFRLQVVVTHPRLVEHLEVGVAFPTTAYDVWWEG